MSWESGKSEIHLLSFRNICTNKAHEKIYSSISENAKDIPDRNIHTLVGRSFARMKKQIPIINASYLLYKHERHRGWVYILIDDAKKVKNKYPKLKVKGTVDGFAISNCILASYGKEGYVLPVRAEIRKQIKKDEGDRVKVILYKDETKLEIPEEFDLCLKDEPTARKFFYSLSESEQRMYVLWVSSAKKIETKSDRIAKSIELLQKGLKLYEKKN